MSELAWQQKSSWHLEAQGYRVSKAVTGDGVVYTAWKADGRQWESMATGSAKKCMALCERNREITGER